MRAHLVDDFSEGDTCNAPGMQDFGESCRAASGVPVEIMLRWRVIASVLVSLDNRVNAQRDKPRRGSDWGIGYSAVEGAEE